MALDISQFVTAATAGATAGALASWGVKVWWENRVKTASSLALAKFQAELGGVAAAASFDYQRRLQDFNLFVTKKHDAIARLHELLLDAMSRVAHLASTQTTRAVLDHLNAADASHYLQHDANIPSGKRDEILSFWETNREHAVSLLYEYQDWMQPELAQRAWDKAHNERLRSDLYLPPDVSRAASELLHGLAMLLRQASVENGRPSPDTQHRAAAIHKELELLRALMRAEMARGELPARSVPESLTR
jgi:hypothetical protein